MATTQHAPLVSTATRHASTLPSTPASTAAPTTKHATASAPTALAAQNWQSDVGTPENQNPHFAAKPRSRHAIPAGPKI